MRIAYITADEVNSDLAQHWAQDAGCEVVPLSPTDPFPNGDYDAAIYDLDFLVPTLRDRVLNRLLTTPPHGPVAVHSYNLRRRQVRELTARGVFVLRKLDRGILVLLRREIRRVRAGKQMTKSAIPGESRSEIRGSQAVSTACAF